MMTRAIPPLRVVKTSEFFTNAQAPYVLDNRVLGPALWSLIAVLGSFASPGRTNIEIGQPISTSLIEH